MLYHLLLNFLWKREKDEFRSTKRFFPFTRFLGNESPLEVVPADGVVKNDEKRSDIDRRRVQRLTFRHQILAVVLKRYFGFEDKRFEVILIVDLNTVGAQILNVFRFRIVHNMGCGENCRGWPCNPDHCLFEVHTLLASINQLLCAFN